MSTFELLLLVLDLGAEDHVGLELPVLGLSLHEEGVAGLFFSKVYKAEDEIGVVASNCVLDVYLSIWLELGETIGVQVVQLSAEVDSSNLGVLSCLLRSQFLRGRLLLKILLELGVDVDVGVTFNDGLGVVHSASIVLDHTTSNRDVGIAREGVAGDLGGVLLIV